MDEKWVKTGLKYKEKNIIVINSLISFAISNLYFSLPRLFYPVFILNNTG